MNVLLTCVGRRVYLLKAFQAAVRPWNGRVFGGDRDELAPALHMADEAFQLPDVDSASYVPRLIDLTRRHSIQLIVPTIDPELTVLSGAATAFQKLGCQVLVSVPSFVRMAMDKWETLQSAQAHGILTVPSWLPEALPENVPSRLFVKPRLGSASKGIFSVPRTRLQHALVLTDNPLIQEAIGTPEITIDVLFDFDGQLLHYVPRRRLRTLAGESIQGVTLPDDDLRPWLTQLLTFCGNLGARGPLTVQAFMTPRGPMLSEINARFGGGFPLAHAAGAHYPEWIIRILRDEAISPTLGTYTKGLYMTRYHTEILTEAPFFGENGRFGTHG